MIRPLLMGAISHALVLKWGFVICVVLKGVALLLTIMVAQ